MSLRVSIVLIVPVALAVACDRAGPSSMDQPGLIGPSPTTSAAAATALASPAALERLVNVYDACDPETFNAALGPGTCVRSGGVRFEDFIEQLLRRHSIGSWFFAAPITTLLEGQRFVAINRGGEVHTFTEVDAFGGGIVTALNQLIGETQVAPECQALQPSDFIAPGARFSEEEGEEAGTVRYQCCIHPWMRLEAKVLEK